ncbi:LOW QUALITY PROTEIN: acetyltransferase, GNAT family [Bacillus sp. JCM 19046]|nr:LOW QUALITY PROTEIN: acetyltransferase, GNAT family [Bacillus sp. JCM 19046]
MNITIRPEVQSDYDYTESLIKQAFQNEEQSDQQEHFLVHKIRKSDAFVPQLSLVALTQTKEIVGHILLSKIKISDGTNEADSLALAPVSVAPEYQSKGIGSKLIHAALKRAKELDYDSVIVLGHKDYYPKFGLNQQAYGRFKLPFEVPDEAFMALELTPNSLKNIKGVVHYSEAFLS